MQARSLLARLARRFGAEPRAPRVAASELRSLEALAFDDAREGCVHETYAAFEAVHQAATARDPEVRAALRLIARDELRHAAFSHALHASRVHAARGAHARGAIGRARRSRARVAGFVAGRPRAARERGLARRRSHTGRRAGLACRARARDPAGPGGITPHRCPGLAWGGDYV